jgi:hypothetical protein
MGRFLALTRLLSVALCAGVCACALSVARAQTTNTPPPAAPPPLQDYYVRYGQILKPSETAGYPFKLNMPFPDVGAVKVPSRQELDMRDKIEQLATLSDDDIRQQLVAWPAFAKMSLVDDGAMLARLQNFRDYRRKMAQDEWHRLGLTLTPDQQARFEKDYWNRKLQMDRQLAQQLEPIFQAAQQKLNEDLYREFSMPAGMKPPKPAPKPTNLTNAAGSTPNLAH